PSAAPTIRSLASWLEAGCRPYPPGTAHGTMFGSHSGQLLQPILSLLNLRKAGSRPRLLSILPGNTSGSISLSSISRTRKSTNSPGPGSAVSPSTGCGAASGELFGGWRRVIRNFSIGLGSGLRQPRRTSLAGTSFWLPILSASTFLPRKQKPAFRKTLPFRVPERLGSSVSEAGTRPAPTVEGTAL